MHEQIVCFFRADLSSEFLFIRLQHQVSTKLLSLLLRLGCLSFLSALASICRIRSLVTSKSLPTSSRVWSAFSPIPKRIRNTFSSLGVRVVRTFLVLSERLKLITASAGDTLLGDLEDFSHLFQRELHLFSNLLRGWFTAMFLDQIP